MLFRPQLSVLLLPLLAALVISNGFSQEAQSSDKKMKIAVPPGWQPFAQAGTDFAYQFPGPDTLLFFGISEKKTARQVLNDLRTSSSELKTEDFTSASGWKGTKVSKKQALSTPNTFVFQFYYLFPKAGKTYAVVFTTGICQASQTPEQMFDAIALSVHAK